MVGVPCGRYRFNFGREVSFLPIDGSFDDYFWHLGYEIPRGSSYCHSFSSVPVRSLHQCLLQLVGLVWRRLLGGLCVAVV